MLLAAAMIFASSCSDDEDDETTDEVMSDSVSTDTETETDPDTETETEYESMTETEAESEDTAVTTAETEAAVTTAETTSSEATAAETTEAETTAAETTKNAETTTAAETTKAAETTAAAAKAAEIDVDITGLWTCSESLGTFVDSANIDASGYSMGITSIEFDYDMVIDGYVNFGDDGIANYYIPKTQYEELLFDVYDALYEYFETVASRMNMTVDEYLQLLFKTTWDEFSAAMISQDIESETIAGVESVHIYEGEYDFDGQTLTLYVDDDSISLECTFSDDESSAILSDGEHSFEMTRV